MVPKDFSRLSKKKIKKIGKKLDGKKYKMFKRIFGISDNLIALDMEATLLDEMTSFGQRESAPAILSLL